MKLTKRQLKRIIREEYSRLKRRGLIKESGPYHGNDSHEDVYMGNPDEEQQFVVNDTYELIQVLRKNDGVKAHNLVSTDGIDPFDLVMDLEDQRKVYLHDDGTLELL